jgi:dTDP-4-amino-4,6-dideoxygalactose transaminase
MIHPYDIVSALEKRVAEYSGAPYAVAVDSCTNALLLSMVYYKRDNNIDTVYLPKRTYVGVAYSALNAGLKIIFSTNLWQGAYQIDGTNIIDSARRFRRGMYVPDSMYCLSCHWGKHLKIGRGGFILTDNEKAAHDLRTPLLHATRRSRPWPDADELHALL